MQIQIFKRLVFSTTQHNASIEIFLQQKKTDYQQRNSFHPWTQLTSLQSSFKKPYRRLLIQYANGTWCHVKSVVGDVFSDFPSKWYLWMSQKQGSRLLRCWYKFWWHVSWSPLGMSHRPSSIAHCKGLVWR